MIAKKLFIKSLGAVAVVGGVGGGVAYKINQNIQVQKQEELNKELSAKNIDLQQLIKKLQELNEKLEIVKQNIAATEEEINELVEKNVDSKITNRDLNEEIKTLTISIDSLNKTIKEKAIFKNEKEEAGYQASVNSWTAKILQNHALLVQPKKDLFAKNIALINAKREKNNAKKQKQAALSKKTSDSAVVERFQALFEQHRKEENEAFKLYDEKKWKICVPRPLFSVNPDPLTCLNKKNEIINKAETITESELDELNQNKTNKKTIFLATTGILAQKQRVAAISFNNWSEKTKLFDKKSNAFNQLEIAKTNLERQIKTITSTISEEWKSLNLVKKLLHASKTANSEEKKVLSDALEKKAKEDEKRQNAQDTLLISTQTLEENEKTLAIYKAKLDNLNLQKWDLESAISAKEKLKTSLDKKIDDLKVKNE